MTPPTVVKLREAHLHLQLRGSSAFLPKQFGSVEQRGGNVILWDPGVSGLVGGEGEISTESDHDGERHLTGAAAAPGSRAKSAPCPCLGLLRASSGNPSG